MKIGTKEEYIKIEELERNPENSPCAGDVNVSVTLGLQKFSGFHDGIWFEFSEIKKFITELEILNEKRNGCAKISSIDQKEFVLEIRSSDASGNMEINTQLHQYQYGEIKCWLNHLKGSFETPPEAIKQLISCFKTLTK